MCCEMWAVAALMGGGTKQQKAKLFLLDRYGEIRHRQVCFK
jgi:hypothetical protein